MKMKATTEVLVQRKYDFGTWISSQAPAPGTMPARVPNFRPMIMILSRGVGKERSKETWKSSEDRKIGHRR